MTATSILDDTSLVTSDFDSMFSCVLSLDTSSVRGTTLSDWDVVGYRDAWLFTKKRSLANDAFLVRGTSVINFGPDDESLDEIYDMLPSPRSPEPALNSPLVRDLKAALRDAS